MEGDTVNCLFWVMFIHYEERLVYSIVWRELQINILLDIHILRWPPTAAARYMSVEASVYTVKIQRHSVNA